MGRPSLLATENHSGSDTIPTWVEVASGDASHDRDGHVQRGRGSRD
jgi:hypothetical protein